jgi:hypothetical protein
MPSAFAILKKKVITTYNPFCIPSKAEREKKVFSGKIKLKAVTLTLNYRRYVRPMALYLRSL